MVGKVVGNYRIVEKIGEGGMGAVYRAVDEMLDREVAIKAIRPELAREPQIVERFRAEAKILARVSHPAIATIYSFFHDGGELFLAMEYVFGRPLSEVISAHGAMPWPRAVALLSTALEGIEQAHRVGIIHRDLKPDNLMLTEEEKLKVMDFGIARMAGSSHMTQTGLLVGTLRYVAPEQIRGEEVDQRTDIYALGAVLYQMLTARVPFDGPTDFAILKAQLEDPPRPPGAVIPDLPGWLDRAVLKALEKQPAARFRTVEELRLHLSRQGTAAPGAARGSKPDLPTLILPPRPETSSSATMETDRPRSPHPPIPLPSLPTNVAPAPGSGTSYRPVQRAGWKLGAIAAILAVAVLAAGVLLWTRRGSNEAAPPPTSPLANAETSPSTAAPGVAVPAESAATLTAKPDSSSGANPGTVEQPFRPASTPRIQETPRQTAPPPASPPLPSPAPAVSEEEPQPAPQTTEPAPVAPSSQEVPPASEASPGDELPAEELRRLGDEVVAASQKLLGLYEVFLEQKEDGGAEITDTDNKLLEEIEVLGEAAERFGKRFSPGVFARTRDRFRKADQQGEIRRRFRDVAAVSHRVEALMTEVQPSAEVRQQWQELRRRWTRVSQILRER